MKKIFTALIFIFSTTIVVAQKESFDLITYTPPKGWKKEVTENITSYTIIDKKTNNWCQVGIVKSAASKGNIDADFDSEWQDLIVRNYKITEAPKLNEIEETDGWKIKAGGGNFIFNNSNTAMALLTTASGYNRCMSIVATTNNQDYLTRY
jgi:hypothetical protein